MRIFFPTICFALCILFIPSLKAQVNVQFIHNTPSSPIDVYIDGEKVIDGLGFRSISEYIELEENTNYNLHLSLHPSTSPDQAFHFSEFNSLNAFWGDRIFFLNGLIGHPQIPFSLHFSFVPPLATGSKILFVHHGVPDVPGIRVNVRDQFNYSSNVPFGGSTDVYPLTFFQGDPAIFDIRVSGSSEVLGSYIVNFEDVGDQSIYLFTSGLKNPEDSVYEHGFFGASPDGNVVEFEELPGPEVQFIHNIPNTTIDLYAGEEKIAKQLSYKSATPFLKFHRGGGYSISLSVNSRDSIPAIIETFNLGMQSGYHYVAILNGIPDDDSFPLEMKVFQEYERQSARDRVNLLVFQGSTTVPKADIGFFDPVEDRVLVINDFETGDFDGQFSFPPLEFTISAKASSHSDEVAEVWELPLQMWNNQSIVVVFTGSEEREEHSRGIYVILEDGTMVPLDLATSIAEIKKTNSMGIYPVPANQYINVSLPSQEINGEILIMVFSTEGHLVKKVSVDHKAELVRLETGDLPTGTYIIGLISEDGVRTESFLIKR